MEPDLVLSGIAPAQIPTPHVGLVGALEELLNTARRVSAIHPHRPHVHAHTCVYAHTQAHAHAHVHTRMPSQPVLSPSTLSHNHIPSSRSGNRQSVKVGAADGPTSEEWASGRTPHYPIAARGIVA